MGKFTDFKFPLTPITKETFERQGWLKVNSSDDTSSTYEDDDNEVTDGFLPDYYYRLNLPKNRDDDYAPCLVSNSISERYIMKNELNINQNHFLVKIDDMDWLGLCRYEEEVEALYKLLTGDDIYDVIEELENPSIEIINFKSK
jgi:hypothetical protein